MIARVELAATLLPPLLPGLLRGLLASASVFLALGLPARAAELGPSLDVNTPKTVSAGELAPKPAADIGPGAGEAQTLEGALAQVYLTNPALLAERARLRATDENVPAALSGWRPTVSYQVNVGGGFGKVYQRGKITPFNPTDETQLRRDTFQQSVTATQPLYRGGRTTAATANAENQVRSERANLVAQEEQSFSDAVAAFVGVIEDQQLYELNVSNAEVLSKQLDATNARFGVGEITRTDVAQAQAALAGAIAERETAWGTLQTARATYKQAIGALPPKLIEPQPLNVPIASVEQAQTLAAVNNAAVLAAAYTDAAAKDQVDTAYANLMPQVSFQTQGYYADQSNFVGQKNQGGTFTVQVTAPIYQGGSEYAAIRQAKQSEQQSRKQLDTQKRTAVQLATQYWENYVAAKATVAATRAQIHADEIAVDGVQREALAGTQTTLDVLNAEQLLLSARVTLVQNLAALVNDSYGLAGAVGRLTARDLGINVPFYDEKAYYHAVRQLPFGTGDFATHQPGR